MAGHDRQYVLARPVDAALKAISACHFYLLQYFKTGGMGGKVKTFFFTADEDLSTRVDDGMTPLPVESTSDEGEATNEIVSD